MNKNKYQAKPVYFDPLTGGCSSKPNSPRDEFHASQLEFFVCQRLRDAFGKKRVYRQVKILIKPQTILYPDLYWCCDFRVVSSDSAPIKKHFNVEAKGYQTEEFRLKLQFLEYCNPDEYSKLIIVGLTEGTRIDRNNFTSTIDQAIARIKASF